MEVAFNQTSLLPRKQQRLVQLPGEKNLSIHMNTSVSSQNGSPKASTSTNGVSQQIPQSTARQLDVQIPSSSASDVTDPSPALMSFTPPPETDSQKDIAEPARSPAEQSEKVTNGEGVEKKRRKRRSKLELISTEGMKSRITRNRDDPNTEVVNNYVDSTENKFVRPRVVAPVGIVRQPFKPPKGDLEKEKDKLKIHMVGPKTKTSMNVIESMNRPNRQHNTISEGSDFQANFDQYLAEEFVKPVTKIDDIPDRDDEVMWKDNRVLLKDKERELDDAWKAVRRQFNGKVGIDAMLHRLMLCDYNIELMLTTIEKELLELPQPFEELNEGQQAEFEKLLRKPGIHHGKSFRNMQERFLKGYYLGEIVQYYYDTKHRGCPHTLYHRCQCKQNLVHEFPSVQRFECYNCTKYIWKEIYPERSSRSQSLCPVCDHFYAIRRQHRVGMEKLTESEEKLARTMVELEKQLKQPVSKIEVFAYLEKQRLEKLNARSVAEEVPAQYHNRKPIKTSVTELAELSKKFVPKKDSKCWTTHKWGSSARQFMLKTYSVEEKKLLIKAFQKHGLQYEKIAEELQRFSSCEVEVFYGRFHQELSLDKLVHPQKKEIWLGHASLSRLTGGRPSNSPTPEPTGRRKRAISTDPNYEAYRNVNGPPLPKSTRRTRQTQVVAPVENEENESHSNPAPTVS